jgi:hypothetical protein
MDVAAKDGYRLAKECRYVVLDQRKSLSPSQIQVQTEFFSFWSSYWNGVLQSVGVTETMDPGEFYSQHKITALLHESEIVAMHVMCCYERAEFESSPYFKHFDPAFLTALKKFNVQRLLTLQYLTFNPEWKKAKVKPLVVLPMTIVSLSMLHKELEGADAVVSVARRDVGIANALVKMNFQEILTSGIYNNTPVSYQLSYEPRTYPHPDAEALTEYYWKARIEVTGGTQARVQEAA